MKDVLKALDRKVKCVILPVNNKKYKRVKDHQFFGMLKNRELTVFEEMENLRMSRYSQIRLKRSD